MLFFVVALVSLACGAAVGVAAMRWRAQRARVDDARRRSAERTASSRTGWSRLTPMGTTALGAAALHREAHETFESGEEDRDREVLARLLSDVCDLAAGDEAIFWRWVEARQTQIPFAWSTGGERPAYFDVRTWGSLVRWSAEERELQFAGTPDGVLHMASAPVLGETSSVYGVLTISSAQGLQLDRDALKTWMPRFARQAGSLLQLFDLRQDYARHIRQSDAMLDAVKRINEHRTAETLAEKLAETAVLVTSSSAAGLVRWNAKEKHGVVQAISPAGDLEAGFHVTADSLVGTVCEGRLPLVLEDARSAVMQACPYGGLARPIGSVVVYPIRTEEQVIGAFVVEGVAPGDVGPHESRTLDLLAAVARGSLEIVWEIEEVSERARTDPLTGLANRRHFDEELRRAITQTDRFGGDCSLVLVDLDHFKQVNDTLGHDAGDAVLKHVAQELRDGVRAVDVCARYGGEELALLLPQTSQQGAHELAERLRLAMEARPCSHAGQPVRVTASFGVATYPHPVPYGDWLVAAADKALYEAKSSGRNRVKVIQPNHVTPALYKAR
jgi:diguanylate cyclase (GGDEF)-like protein